MARVGLNFKILTNSLVFASGYINTVSHFIFLKYYNMIKSVFFDVPRFIIIQVINLPTLYKPRKNNRTVTLFI